MIKCDICGDVMTDMSIVRLETGTDEVTEVKDVCEFKCLSKKLRPSAIPEGHRIKKMSKFELKEEFVGANP